MLRGLQCGLSVGTDLNERILQVENRAMEMAQHGFAAFTVKLTKPHQ